jgi:predicted nucleic-acid-binding protein
VIVADTNIWARALLKDDIVQTPKARKLLGEAQASGGIFVPLVVMAELAGVLRTKLSREAVLTTFEELLGSLGVIVESPAIVEVAIKATRAGNGGFADHLIAQVGFAHGATSVVTFDEKFGKAARVKRLK